MKVKFLQNFLIISLENAPDEIISEKKRKLEIPKEEKPTIVTMKFNNPFIPKKQEIIEKHPIWGEIRGEKRKKMQNDSDTDDDNDFLSKGFLKLN